MNHRTVSWRKAPHAAAAIALAVTFLTGGESAALAAQKPRHACRCRFTNAAHPEHGAAAVGRKG